MSTEQMSEAITLQIAGSGDPPANTVWVLAARLTKWVLPARLTTWILRDNIEYNTRGVTDD